jgi:hypothetical protein
VAEDIIEVVAPAMQIVPELQDHYGEPSLVIPKEMDLLGASTVRVTPLLEPNLPSFVDRGVLESTVTHLPMTIGQVVSLSDEVDEVDASASHSKALFAKELCDLLITLELRVGFHWIRQRDH